MNIHMIQKFNYRETRNSPNCSTIFIEFSQNCSWYPVPTALHLLKSSNFTLSKWSKWHNEYPATLPDYDDDAKHSLLWKHQIHHLPWHHPHHPKSYKCKGSPFLGHRAMKKQVLYDSPLHLLMIHLLTITYFLLMRISKAVLVKVRGALKCKGLLEPRCKAQARACMKWSTHF